MLAVFVGMLASRGIIGFHCSQHHHPHPHPYSSDIRTEHHPNNVPKISSYHSGSHLRSDNNEYNEWLHVDTLLERVAVDLRVMSTRDNELDRVRVLIAAIDSRKYRRRSRAHSLDNHGQRELVVKPVRRSVSARTTTNKLKELTHALMENNKLTRSASLVIINNSNNNDSNNHNSKIQTCETSVTTLPRIGRSETQRVTLRNLRQRSLDGNSKGENNLEIEKPIKTCNPNPNRFSLDVESARNSYQFSIPSSRSPISSKKYYKKKLRGE